ncbi:4-hydroxythreonine-4-phosphate dehydrogenase PdxA, partial [Enterobacter hormaechei]|uniref:4-hydroxythreonine-4-phosphate dehydrogenase PdxA n=1 Tax=Enterobacter hormaechei TaxID=158836 RepID=UPI001954ACDE
VPLPSGAAIEAEPGRPDTAQAGATIESISAAVGFVRAGRASAVVTNPIAKHVLTAVGFAHPGHTEFLAALSVPAGGPQP